MICLCSILQELVNSWSKVSYVDLSGDIETINHLIFGQQISICYTLITMSSYGLIVDPWYTLYIYTLVCIYIYTYCIYRYTLYIYTIYIYTLYIYIHYIYTTIYIYTSIYIHYIYTLYIYTLYIYILYIYTFIYIIYIYIYLHMNGWCCNHIPIFPNFRDCKKRPPLDHCKNLLSAHAKAGNFQVRKYLLFPRKKWDLTTFWFWIGENRSHIGKSTC